jgi:hypothetical protein
MSYKILILLYKLFIKQYSGGPSWGFSLYFPCICGPRHPALQFFGMGFAGQVLMLEKAALRQNLSLTIVGARPSIGRALKWCGLKHLIGKNGR